MSAHAGAFRHRLVLERREDVPDGSGAFVSRWIELRKVWARMTSGAMAGHWTGQREEARRHTTVVMRWRTDVVPGMRFRFTGRLLLITATRDDDGMRRLLVCECEESVP